MRKIAAWGGVCCPESPSVTVSIRKARHSYDSIISRKAFTAGIANEAHITENIWKKHIIS